MTDQLRQAAQRLIDAAEQAAKHFGYQRLGGSSLEDSNVRCELHASAAEMRSALAAPQAEPLFLGACLTDGKLHATVMCYGPNKTVHVVANAEIDEAMLRSKDVVTTMAHPAPAADVVRDAERYRWLREQSWHSSSICAVHAPKENVRLGAFCPSREQLDAAIDAAMKGADHE